jgi:hypothetical protein
MPIFAEYWRASLNIGSDHKNGLQALDRKTSIANLSKNAYTADW